MRYSQEQPSEPPNNMYVVVAGVAVLAVVGVFGVYVSRALLFFLQPPPYKNNMQGRSELQTSEISEIERTKTPIENPFVKVVDNDINITLVNL